ncbi:DNA-3-methyladenine glycosylase II [Neisseria perflava]|uniref:DNA-3-methyladenine glycosylase family protein n=1 Tax=Neisseria perflava TaxID=33053 RepID=UPI0020A1CE09|nr:hypothetical protein [Neisseria perflava]MCP1771868.1 DNA-3-methyladenine glycosylase II [Neisseria perflava]
MSTDNFPEYAVGVAHLQKRDKKMAWLIGQIGEVGFCDRKEDFCFLAEQIIGQMLSVKAANTIIARLAALCGGEITAQAVCRFSAEELKSVGISGRKAECMRALAQAVQRGDLDFGRLKDLSDRDITAALTAFKGIGGWTAKMYLYKIHRPDVLPFEDVILLSAYRWLYRTKDDSPAAVKKRAQKWSPYCSIASMFLYEAAERGLLDKEVPRLKDL